MKLSVCMIVRDNEDIIRPCLESIRPWVDEMIVVDTGSDDRTPQIAEEYGAQLFHFPWCDDFSAARNVSLEKASGEWLFWMDSDDTISAECGQRLRALADGEHLPNVLGYIMQVHCPGGNDAGIREHTVVDHVKLFRNRPDIRFEGRIHEQVLMPIRRLGGEIAWTDIYVTHSGSDRSEEAQKRKISRDLRILQKDLEERPSHPFVLFNFAMTHAESDNFEEAIQWCQKCLEHSQLHESHVPKTYAYLANCYLQLEQNESALEICRQARKHFPTDPELLFREAMSWQSLDKHAEAIRCYQTILSLPKENKLKSTDPGITGFKCRFNLGVAFRDAKMDRHAERAWRQVLDERPGYLPAIRALGELWKSGGKNLTSKIEARKLRDNDLTTLDGVLLEAQIEQSCGNIVVANQLYKQSFAMAPNDSFVLEKCCHFFFENGDQDTCADLLERLIDCDQNNAAAYHNLASIRLQQNQHESAINLLRKSLEIRPNYSPTLSLLARAQQR